MSFQYEVICPNCKTLFMTDCGFCFAKNQQIKSLNAIIDEAERALEYAEQDFDASDESKLKAQECLSKIKKMKGGK